MGFHVGTVMEKILPPTLRGSPSGGGKTNRAETQGGMSRLTGKTGNAATRGSEPGIRSMGFLLDLGYHPPAVQ